MSRSRRQLLVRVLTVIGLILAIGMMVVIYKTNYFEDEFPKLLSSMGIFAPFIYFILRVGQAIIPIVPFSLMDVSANVVFGYYGGWLLNISAVLVGSVLIYELGKRYGEEFILSFVSEDLYNKYKGYLGDLKEFRKWMIIALIVPAMSDELMCALAGLIKMPKKDYYKLVLIFRPLTMIVFSTGFTELLAYIYNIVK